MKHWLFCIITGLILLVLTTNTSLPIYAQTETPGVDLFILIDQSQSMSGTPNDAPTDPQNLRIDTAHYLVDQLGFDALTRPDRVNRVSAIGFGTYERSQVLVPLTSVSGETVEQSAEIRDAIKQDIEPQQLGYTSMTAALDLAASELEGAEKLGENRPVIVFLITDGSPYDQRELSLTDYFSEINDSYARLQEQSFNQLRMFVVGIDAEFLYWPGVSSFWEEVAVESSRVEQAEEMKSALATILANELGYDSTALSAGELFVEPYLETISLSIFRYSETPVEVFYPDANGVLQRYDFDQAETRASGDRYDLLIIRHPNPGLWKIQSQQEAERVDIVRQIEFSRVQIEPPIFEKPRYFPTNFYFSLPQGQRFYEQYPLTFEVSVTAPSATESQSLRCCVLAEDNQFFRTADTYIPMLAGQYQVSVSATVQLLVDDNIQEVLISEEIYTFSTYDATLTLEPTNSHYSQYEPVSELQVIFTDEQGRRIIEDPLVELGLVTRVETSTGSHQEITMNRVENGIYQITQPFMLPGNEEKSIELVGFAPSGEELFSTAYVINIFRNIRMLEPFPALPPQANYSSLAIQLLDDNGLPISDDVAATLILQAKIIPPQGLHQLAELTYVPEEQAFVAEVPIPTQSVGAHFVEISAQTSLAGRTVDAFTDTQTYAVTADLPYYRILSPTSTVYPLYEGLNKATLPLEIQWIQNNRPINPSDVFVDEPSALITAMVGGPNGLVLNGLRLQPTDPDDPSRWGIDLSTLRSEGVYTATFQFNGGSLISQQPYMPFADTEVTFSRVTTDLWRGIISARNTLGALFMIIVMAAIITESYQRLWPPFPKGTLVVKEQNPSTGQERQIDMINLFKRRTKRRTVTWKPVASELKALGIRKVVIRPRPDRTGKTVPGIDMEFIGDDESIFSMSFTTTGKKRWPRAVSESTAIYWINYQV